MNPFTWTCASLLVIQLLSVAVDGQSPPSTTTTTTTATPPTAPTVEATRFFFDAFQRAPQQRDEAIRRLTEEALAPDASMKEVLYTGLAHLWAMVEEPRDRIDAYHHAILAERWLAKAESLDPEDTRIRGWHANARLSVAIHEGDEAKQHASLAALEALAIEDPCFNSITLGTVAFEYPKDHPTFQRALTAMNAAFDCGQTRGGQDQPRWPHSVAGFLVTLSDFRLKAGDVAGAESALVIAESRESSATWPHRHLVEERLNTFKERALRFANDDPKDDPPFVLRRGAANCSVCHAAAPK